jgi:hypothetical protein
VTRRHSNIRQDDIRTLPFDGVEQFIAALADCHDVDVLDGRQELAQALPHQEVVLCQDDSDRQAEAIIG